MEPSLHLMYRYVTLKNRKHVNELQLSLIIKHIFPPESYERVKKINKHISISPREQESESALLKRLNVIITVTFLH